MENINSIQIITREKKRVIREREITIPGKSVGLIEIQTVSMDASEGIVLRKWDDVEPGYQAKEITGDMLNKAHPNPMGRVLNTTCCRNIPIFVPRSIEIKNLFCCFLSMFFKKKLILNPFRLIKKIIAPNNLISVVRKGDKLL